MLVVFNVDLIYRGLTQSVYGIVCLDRDFLTFTVITVHPVSDDEGSAI